VSVALVSQWTQFTGYSTGCHLPSLLSSAHTTLMYTGIYLDLIDLPCRPTVGVTGVDLWVDRGHSPDILKYRRRPVFRPLIFRG